MKYKIYIVHYKKNIDRRKYLEEKLKSLDNVFWVENFQDVSEIPLNLKYSITPKEMLVWLSHFNILLNECKSSDIDNKFIILEDDVIFPDDMNIDNFFTNVLDEFHKSNAEMIYLGKIPGLEVTTPIPDKKVYTDVKQCSVCTHAYSLKTTLFKPLINYMETNLPIDHEMNRMIDKFKIKVAWSYPALDQGTITNLYKSNLR